MDATFYRLLVTCALLAVKSTAKESGRINWKGLRERQAIGVGVREYGFPTLVQNVKLISNPSWLPGNAPPKWPGELSPYGKSIIGVHSCVHSCNGHLAFECRARGNSRGEIYLADYNTPPLHVVKV